MLIWFWLFLNCLNKIQVSNLYPRFYPSIVFSLVFIRERAQLLCGSRFSVLIIEIRVAGVKLQLWGEFSRIQALYPTSDIEFNLFVRGGFKLLGSKSQMLVGSKLLFAHQSINWPLTSELLELLLEAV